ncbi:hypothetical protein BB558_000158 [Smittium angustum]|nr:hypothetical protein BB558_000158 [Smittium angustum]
MTEEPKKGVEVKILTQNIFIRPPIINNNGNDFKTERLEWFLNNIVGKYDVVCLQEMFQYASSRHKKMMDGAKEHGLVHSVSSPSRGLFYAGIDAGLMILSRYPITYSEFLQYERGVHSDAMSLKGVLYGKIHVGGKDSEKCIHVFNTHTQASYGNVELTQPGVIKRLSQLKALHEFVDKMIKEHRKPGELAIINGDMNVDSRKHNVPDKENGGIEQDERDGKEHSDEYLAMMGIIEGRGLPDPSIFGFPPDKNFESENKLKFVDTVYSKHGYHPVTFGNIKVLPETNKPVPMETVLTTKGDNMAMHSLDYILWYEPHVIENETGDVDFGSQNKVVEAHVEPNFTGDDQKFTQISDHYGASAKIWVGL